jgi:hypothetical protein
VRLETSLGVADIASHYAPAIVAAKWRLTGRHAGGDEMSVTRFDGTTTSGDPVTALLTVTRLAGNRIDVALRYVRHDLRLPAGGRSGGAGASARGAVSPSAVPTRPPDAPDVLQTILLTDQVAGPAESYELRSGMPPGFPKDLLPAGATVGAAAVAKSMTTVVAAVPGFEMTSVPRHLQILRAAGWVSTAARMLAGFSQASFVSTQVTRGNESATLRFFPRQSGGVHIRASVRPEASRVPAGPPGPLQRPFADVAMPLLFLPPAARIEGGGGSGGGFDRYQWAARVENLAAFAPAVSHFVDQMAHAGWPMTSRAGDATVSVTRHALTTASGEPITAMLSLLPIPGTSSVDANLRVIRHNPR